MYRLLIVDDEPIIVEGLFDKFLQLTERPFEVCKAYNGEEALGIARRARVDLLLTDLKMPGMDGLQLQQEVQQLWPKCKTVFLTGHNDFQSIQSSMRGGAFDYVLKMEMDYKIIEAVTRAADAIAEENSHERMLSEARHRWTQALPILCKEYVLELVEGERSSPHTRAARFSDLKLPLDAQARVHLGIGRVDEWPDDIRPGDKSLLLYGVHNVIEEHFAEGCRIVFVTYGNDRFLWLLQLEPGLDHETALQRQSRILGIVESAQTACRTYLKLPCSFVAGCEPCDWEELPRKFGQLDFLLTRGLGLGREILLSDASPSPSATNDTAARLQEREITQLMQALERKDGIDFHRRLAAVSSAIGETEAIQSGMALTLFYSLSSSFLQLMNRSGLLESLPERIDMNKLLGAQEHAAWGDAAKFFGELADLVIEKVEAESGRESNEVVERVQHFVRENIGGDLSLAKLSEVVFLTPFYLSRLYKQQTGRSLTDYITEIKLSMAKDMLVGTNSKIYEVGIHLGFHSSPYFNHFFKKQTNMTPQEYRDTWTPRPAKHD
ncbi:response regulator [Paenibacillus rhizovicinus]|uniref:Response regulator n=1 Tax=Paenibacillus rhizovicinus TaxID=2704463 RepID=A0A6C0NX33_9BACL|nr:response regulator [Paenibacillus rhizovicinus]QHW30795.1 response regulator [Paenibacillus rhizovicinus]